MIVYALRSVAIVFLTAGCSIATLVAHSLARGEASASRVMCWWGKNFILLGKWSVDVEGMENVPPGGAVLVSNHQSVVDIPLLIFAFRRPVRFLAKRELKKVPLLGKAMAAAGNLFVERGDPQDARRMFREAAERLSAGQLLVFFPEGRRTRDGAMGHFKTGAVRLAREAGAPLVPVYIDGGYRALPRKARCFRPARLLVRVLPPMTADERAEEAPERVAAFIRARILAEGSAAAEREAG